MIFKESILNISRVIRWLIIIESIILIVQFIDVKMDTNFYNYIISDGLSNIFTLINFLSTFFLLFFGIIRILFYKTGYRDFVNYLSIFASILSLILMYKEVVIEKAF